MYINLELFNIILMGIDARVLFAFPQTGWKQIFDSVIAKWIVFRFKYVIVNWFWK